MTLYEADARLGGHTHTVTSDDGNLVDTGFIVCNDRTYPEFLHFLDEYPWDGVLPLDGRI